MRLVLPVPPSANRWWRKGGGVLYTPESVTSFKAKVMVACRNAGVRKIPRNVPVSVTVAWFRKAKQGDLDKRIGILLDALEGHAYEDDVQITRILAERFEDPAHPRLEVEVAPISKEAAA